MEKPMTSHRPLRSTVDGLAAVAIAAAFMAGAPIGAAAAAGVGGGGSAGGGAAAASGQASNGSGYEPSETDCVNVAQQPGRYAPDDLSACGLTPPMGGYGDYPRHG
jgi:hypothetical protein